MQSIDLCIYSIYTYIYIPYIYVYKNNILDNYLNQPLNLMGHIGLLYTDLMCFECSNNWNGYSNIVCEGLRYYRQHMLL